MRIAVDIDSTLHHYWDQLAAIAKRRFGVDLPYDDQHTWTITRLRPEQVHVCVAETHGEANVLAAEPYPGAVEAIRAWHEAGHFIQVTSHRTTGITPATIVHPWNRDLCEEEDIVWASDWPTLAQRLEPLLARGA